MSLDKMDEYVEIKVESNYNKVQELYTELVVNCLEIDKILESIKELEEKSTEIDQLENLYGNEFFLYMKHIGIYSDLMDYLDKVERTEENEFELARIKRDAERFRRVDVIEF